jgi:hypothetical protein
MKLSEAIIYADQLIQKKRVELSTERLNFTSHMDGSIEVSCRFMYGKFNRIFPNIDDLFTWLKTPTMQEDEGVLFDNDHQPMHHVL